MQAFDSDCEQGKVQPAEIAGNNDGLAAYKENIIGIAFRLAVASGALGRAPLTFMEQDGHAKCLSIALFKEFPSLPTLLPQVGLNRSGLLEAPLVAVP